MKTTNKSMSIKLLVFAIGAFALVIGDYMYGTTFYTDMPTDQEQRFMYSGLLGFFAAVCYMYGIFGYGDGFISSESILKKLTIGGLGVFTIGVAVTHSLASAHMYVFNENLVSPNTAEIERVFTSINDAYEVYFIPMILGLVVGYVSLFIAILRGFTVFKKRSLLVFPLILAILISLLDSSIANYPILLKSAAWSGVIFNVALLLLGYKSRIREDT